MSTVALRFLQFQSALDTYFRSNNLHLTRFRDMTHMLRIFTDVFEKICDNNLTPATDAPQKIFENLNLQSIVGEELALAQISVAAAELEQTIDMLPCIDLPSYEFKQFCKLSWTKICSFLQQSIFLNVTATFKKLLGNNLTQSAAQPVHLTEVPAVANLACAANNQTLQQALFLPPPPINSLAMVQKSANLAPMTSLHMAAHAPSRKKPNISTDVDDGDDDDDHEERENVRQCIDCKKNFDPKMSQSKLFCVPCRALFDEYRGPKTRKSALAGYKQELLKKGNNVDNAKKRKGQFDDDSSQACKLTFDSAAANDEDNDLRTELIVGASQF